MFSTVLLIYSLISGAVLTLLWLVFRLAGINKLTCHRLNRGLLVAMLVASIVLPAFAFLEKKPAESPVPVVIEAPGAIEVTGVAVIEPSFWDKVVDALPVIYVIGLVASAVWLLIALIGVAFAIIRGEKHRIDRSTTLVVHSRSITPFTWGRWIIISRSDLEANAEMLLAHENAHKVAVHWLDLLVGRIVACVDWYWPSAWLIIRDLSAVHEFQADRFVVSGGNDAAAYQMLLIRKGTSGIFSNLVNPFSYYSLKNRITMMQKKQSSTRSRMRCLVMLPAAAVAILFSTAPALASAVKSALPVSVKSYSETDERLNFSDAALDANHYGEEVSNESAIVSTEEIVSESKDVQKSSASFPGGEVAMFKFLSQNLRYPEQCAQKNIQGRVLVQFLVQKDGSISDAKVIDGVDPQLDAEAIRVVESMPKFEPATENGEAVAEWFTLPINFKLQEDDDEHRLYLLDGKAVTADDIRSLDKSEIDGVNVLPGDKAKEMFGNDAAKGAVVVQTKAYAMEQAKLKGLIAKFPGGEAAMYQFIARYIRYPEEAARKNIQGVVIVQFKVQKDGSITDVSALKGVDPLLDAEAVRVMEVMPKFEPATENGEAVAVWQTLPISFKMNI